jgi:DNA modification methylase
MRFWFVQFVESLEQLGHFIMTLYSFVPQVKTIAVSNKDKEVPIFKQHLTTATCVQFLLMTSEDGGKIFAPFTGSGSLANASLLTGRHFHGFAFDFDHTAKLSQSLVHLKTRLQKDPLKVFNR